MKNLYTTLGLKKDANANEIKQAYRKLALEFHPDKNQSPEAEDKFKEISAAYEVLKDPQKKSEYDQFGKVGGQNHQQYPSSHDIFGLNINDFFTDFFSQRNAQARAKGQNLKQRIVISFMEAAKGCEKNIQIERPEDCKKCNKTGAYSDKYIVECKSCNGLGKVSQASRQMQFITTCNACNGRGHKITKLCTKCSGHGTYNIKENLKVFIPAGIDNGMSIRLKNKGMPGVAEHGDLYLYLMISPHKVFTRDGLNIKSEHTISYLDAILGAKLNIETIHGNISATVPPGTQYNSTLRVADKGIITKSNNGHHLANIKIDIPRNLSDKERKALEKLREI